MASKKSDAATKDVVVAQITHVGTETDRSNLTELLAPASALQKIANQNNWGFQYTQIAEEIERECGIQSIETSNMRHEEWIAPGRVWSQGVRSYGSRSTPLLDRLIYIEIAVILFGVAAWLTWKFSGKQIVAAIAIIIGVIASALFLAAFLQSNTGRREVLNQIYHGRWQHLTNGGGSMIIVAFQFALFLVWLVAMSISGIFIKQSDTDPDQ